MLTMTIDEVLFSIGLCFVFWDFIFLLSSVDLFFSYTQDIRTVGKYIVTEQIEMYV